MIERHVARMRVVEHPRQDVVGRGAGKGGRSAAPDVAGKVFESEAAVRGIGSLSLK